MKSNGNCDPCPDGEMMDAAIVGGGIAGLSAALFLARAGRATVVYDTGRARILSVERVREFIGYDGWTPAEMLTKARQEVVRYGASIRNKAITKIDQRPDGLFTVWAEDHAIIARSVVLATGLKDELPALTGLREVWGRDLRICPCFDGSEVRDQRFVVFGTPERLAHFASWLTMWSPRVSVVTTHDFDVEATERLQLLGVKTVRDEVTGLVHADERLVAVATRSGVEIACDAAWIAASLRPASDLAASLCTVDRDGFAKTDEHGRTSKPGVFAVGNASNPIAHLAHAAAAGTDVGPWVTLYLLESLLSEKRREKISQ